MHCNHLTNFYLVVFNTSIILILVQFSVTLGFNFRTLYPISFNYFPKEHGQNPLYFCTTYHEYVKYTSVFKNTIISQLQRIQQNVIRLGDEIP